MTGAIVIVLALVAWVVMVQWVRQDAERRDWVGGRDAAGWSTIVFWLGVFGLAWYLVARRRAPVIAGRAR